MAHSPWQENNLLKNNHGLWTMDYLLKMSLPSLIFWAVFVLPLVAFLIWVMRQDKKKGVTGLVVLGILVVVAIAYMYWKTGGN